eukprot:3529315-Amphidinium_carterae.5
MENYACNRSGADGIRCFGECLAFVVLALQSPDFHPNAECLISVRSIRVHHLVLLALERLAPEWHLVSAQRLRPKQTLCLESLAGSKHAQCHNDSNCIPLLWQGLPSKVRDVNIDLNIENTGLFVPLLCLEVSVTPSTYLQRKRREFRSTKRHA